MTNEFAVIGHHRDQAETLLLLGADGHHYRYGLMDNRLKAVDPHDEWVLELDDVALPVRSEHSALTTLMS